MKNTGIDYGHGKTNIDVETSIRFGVISQNSIMPESFDDIWTQARDLSYEAARKDAEKSAVEAEEEFDEGSFNDGYEDNGSREWLYERDGYRLVNCLDCDMMVLRSPYFTYAQFCSPCVPGAGNLDSPLTEPEPANKCYCLGHDWFESGKALYPVYSVKTGALVEQS